MHSASSTLPAIRRSHPGRAAILLVAALALIFPTAPAFAQKTVALSPPGMTASKQKISADGTLVVFYNYYGIGLHEVRPDGSRLKPLNTHETYAHSLSGDGRLLVRDWGGEIIRRDLETGVETPLYPWTPTAGGIMPEISRDGSKVVFQDYFLHIVDADGSGLLHVGGGVFPLQGGASITADGGLIAFDCTNETNGYYGICTVLSDGTDLEWLTPPGYTYYTHARISHDGGTITFDEYHGDLYAIDGDGSNLRQLTFGLEALWYGEGFDSSDISGDGSLAVFSSWEGLFVVRTDGSGLRQINGRSGAVAIDGRGDVVVYSQWSSPNTIHAAGVPGVAPGEMTDVEVSGDGGTLTWGTRPSAYSHNVYRAAWSTMGSVAPAAAGGCLAGGIPGSSAPVAGDPLPGEAFGFYVTAENAWGEGTAGATVAGIERTPDLSCPDADSDGDGFPDATDVCPLVADPGQENPDGDGLGSACDNCPRKANDDQSDLDWNGVGDRCDQPGP